MHLKVLVVLLFNYALGLNVDYNELFGTSPRATLPFPELVSHDGYISKNYTVNTEDGYLLTLFRIPIQKSCKASKGSLLFMHGMTVSGDDCIVPGPGRAHCYIYADNCYDVWVGNTRGNQYSRNHVNLNPDTDPEFWDFAFDEIALFDLPAIIDFILKYNGEKQLSYIGHSQGVTTLLILCSKRPEYNKKIKVGFSLSGLAWWYQSNFNFEQMFLNAYMTLSPVLNLINNNGINTEVLSNGSFTPILRKMLCRISTTPYPYCTLAGFGLAGYNQDQISENLLPVIAGHNPSGASLKNLNRWGQAKINGFSEYDYGQLQNMRVYKSPEPLVYNVSNIQMHWVFAASLVENVSKVSDLMILTDRLNSYDICIHKDLRHFDFVYGKAVQDSLAPMILNYLETGRTNCYT